MAVTRDDVARAAGVSTAVVSYVLNDGPRPVSAAARERVVAAIRDLGYRRDGVARHLRVGRTQSLGLVLPDFALPYFAEFTEHLIAAGAARDRQVLLASSDWDVDREHVSISSLVERRVDGIVLLSADPSQDFAPMTTTGVPIVVVDRPEVTQRGTADVAWHLHEHGHRALALLSGPLEVLLHRRRLAAWEQALRRLGLDVRPEWVVSAEVSRRGGYEGAAALLDLPEPPTAVYVGSDVQALGFLRGAHERGVRIPRDCGVVTAEGTEQAVYSVPSLTSITQPVARIATMAFDAVLGAPPGVHPISDAEYTFEPRESCGPH